ncbi:MAG: hypothetical protein QOD30_922 [Actinomycetota bacterium]|jgi:hypothetical protein|nr:hypothetical protein [Actinomycetota bacterium]
MTSKRRIVIGGIVSALAMGGAATGVAVASSSGDSDHRAIHGKAYDRATAKALEVTGGGRVTETEKGDEESYYQVEVRKSDGTQVDVNLDRHFNLVKTKTEPAETSGSESNDGND